MSRFAIKCSKSKGYAIYGSNIVLAKKLEHATVFTDKEFAERICNDLKMYSIHNRETLLSNQHYFIKKQATGFFIHPDNFDPVVVSI